MIQEIMRDTDFLAHKDGCVGMAANMIGVKKPIISFDNGGSCMLLFNPQIVKKAEHIEDVPATTALFDLISRDLKKRADVLCPDG